MTDERHDFAQARVRLEEIVAQVRKKDTSLERSLDLLEEGVRLANVCTELSDHTEWRKVIEQAEEPQATTGEGEPAEPTSGDDLAATPDAPESADEPVTEPDETPEPTPEGPLGDEAVEPSSAE